MTISFNVSHDETIQIAAIARRAVQIGKRTNAGRIDPLDITMDLSACIANGTPLNLIGLLAADDFDFMHDVMGINKHMDRDDGSPTGGKLLNCFRPRFARNEKQPAAV